MPFVGIKMGRRQGARSGAYLKGYATDEQRSRRPIFIATLRAAASWLLFHVARSLRIAPVLRWRHGRRAIGVQNWCGMLVGTASPARTALKISQLSGGERHATSATGH